MPVSAGTALVLAHAGEKLFKSSLEACGYQLIGLQPRHIEPQDVVVAWNRRACDENTLRRYEAAGATVLIAENGYLGCDDEGKKLIALSIGHHAGAGNWHIGQEERWRRQHIAVFPWRHDGGHIVVMLQRGIGEPGIAMPPDWPAKIEAELKRITRRPIVLQQHPGKVSLAEAAAIIERDIFNAWAVVGWSSARPLKAVVAGIPAFYGCRDWIGAPMAKFGVADIENPWRGDREAALHSIGWAQWSAAEISAGTPFEYLLRKPT